MIKPLGSFITFIAMVLACCLPGMAQEYSLGDLYRQALKNSEQIKIAEENVSIAQMGQNKAMAVIIPRLKSYATYGRYSVSKYGDPPYYSTVLVHPHEYGNWGVRADQSFSMSARELDALKIAGQTITKNVYDLEATRSEYLLSVASAYYDVLKSRKSLEIAAANMTRLTEYRHSVEKRVKVGESTKTALLRAEGELSGARADYLRATNGLYLTRAALIRMTGIEENFRLKDEPALLRDNYSLKQLNKTAEENRSDLKSYDMAMQMAQRQVKYARGAFWPDVGLFAIFDRNDQDPKGSTFSRENVLAGVSLSFPFFEGGLRVAEFKEAKAKERQARLAYDNFKKNMNMELQSVYLELETQKGTLKYLDDQVIFAQDNYDAVLRQFENGLATSLDVMDANSLLLASEKNYADAWYGYQLAQLKILKSSGTLLQFIHEEKQ